MAKRTKRPLSSFIPGTEEVFFEHYVLTGDVAQACEKVGVRVAAFYERKTTDPEFAKRYRVAQEQIGDILEQEARRRAVEGWDEPIYHKGELSGTVRKFSDNLLALLLKAHKPDKYATRSKSESKVDLSSETIEELRSKLPEALAALGVSSGKGEHVH